jgi:hypothetical protein
LFVIIDDQNAGRQLMRIPVFIPLPGVTSAGPIAGSWFFWLTHKKGTHVQSISRIEKSNPICCSALREGKAHLGRAEKNRVL